MRQRERLVGVEVATRECGRRDVVEGRHREVRFEFGEGSGARQVERADSGAAQRTQMATDAKGGADVAGQRPDVGARRAGDFNVDIEHAQLGVGAERLSPRTG